MPETELAATLAFTTREAQRLTGLSARRLQYWDETDFIRPSVAARRGRGSPRLYSFRNLVELRVAALLRDSLSLQALRKLKAALDVNSPFATVRFAIVPTTNELVYVGPVGPESVRAPGQMTMTFNVPLEEIRSDLVAGIRRLRERHGVGKIDKQRGVMAGQPRVAGTRVTPAAIARLVAAGWSHERIRDEYPGVEEPDIAAALRHERQDRRAS